LKVLLDTHAFLWAITDDPKLTPLARRIFSAGDNELFLSVASVWEMLTKVQIGKLPFPKSPGAYIKQEMARNNVRPLPILMTHALHLERLPRHHRDPFDRILVSQSVVEGMPLLSADPQLKNYGAALMW
jgi:PIN domain nuclease of toxin-antitoxin system